MGANNPSSVGESSRSERESIPGIRLSGNIFDPYKIYISYGCKTENIKIFPESTLEDICLVLLSIIGLKYDDFESNRCTLSLSNQGETIQGELLQNVPENPYILSLNLGLGVLKLHKAYSF